MSNRSARKNAYNTVDKMFKREHDIRLAVAEELTRKGNGSGPPNHDPTGTQAVRNLRIIKCVTLASGAKIYHPQKWVYLIDWTYDNSDEYERKVAELFYRHRKSVIAICMTCACSQTTAYQILREFKQLAVEGACQLGLIEILPRR